jgi:predicted PurR-regulated permease PerM
MINTDRVRQMTHMSMKETGDIGAQINIARHTYSDYLTIQVAVSAVSGTLCFIAGFILWLSLNWNFVNRQIADHGFRRVAAMIAAAYLIFLGLYLLLSFLVANYRYKTASAMTELYLKDLDRLEASYEEEEQASRKPQSEGNPETAEASAGGAGETEENSAGAAQPPGDTEPEDKNR